MIMNKQKPNITQTLQKSIDELGIELKIQEHFENNLYVYIDFPSSFFEGCPKEDIFSAQSYCDISEIMLGKCLPDHMNDISEKTVWAADCVYLSLLVKENEEYKCGTWKPKTYHLRIKTQIEAIYKRMTITPTIIRKTIEGDFRVLRNDFIK